MADNSLKTPFVYAQNMHAAARAKAVQALLGKGLPCTVVAVGAGPTVTVKFEVNSIFNIPNITMPVQTPEYVRLPIQIGDKGRAMPTTVPVAAISGFGMGTPNLGVTGNLTTLVFEPVSNKNWFAVDPNALTLYGPNGVVLEDSAKKTVLTLTPTGATFTTPSGDKFTFNCDIVVSGIGFLAHVHDDPQGGVTGPPHN